MVLAKPWLAACSPLDLSLKTHMFSVQRCTALQSVTWQQVLHLELVHTMDNCKQY